ncbi:MAG TPA: guanylate kinase [Tepidimicrobium sp.]|nr:guanylate kinase [Tepidimicrobium sp.]
MSKGFLLVISGPSGSGKGTICAELLKRNKDLVFSVSATTRGARQGEKEGISYFFMDNERFQKMIENDEFIEYAKVHTNYYGTPRKFVTNQIGKGNIVILEIDVQGALQVKKSYPEAVLIFLLPPSMDELKNRLIGRGTESQEEIEIRYKNAFKEMKYIYEYDYFVVNDNIMEALKEIEAIIIAEKAKINRGKNILGKLLVEGGM